MTTIIGGATPKSFALIAAAFVIRPARARRPAAE
jgi:hypothetical protein